MALAIDAFIARASTSRESLCRGLILLAMCVRQLRMQGVDGDDMPIAFEISDVLAAKMECAETEMRRIAETTDPGAQRTAQLHEIIQRGQVEAEAVLRTASFLDDAFAFPTSSLTMH
jgi:hypothetical protein